MKQPVSDSSSSMRIAVIAHPLRAGGGISVGQNLIAAFVEVAPRHSYLFSIPAGLGYEAVCERAPSSKTVVLERPTVIRRALFDLVHLPRAVRSFAPDVVFGLGNMGLQGRHRYPQSLLLHSSYLWYGRRHYGETTLSSELLKVWIQRRLLVRDLRRTDLLCCQTKVAIDRIVQIYGYEGKSCLCPNAVSEFTVAGDSADQVPEALRRFSGKTRLFYLTRYYPHKNLEVLLRMFDRFRDDLSSVVLFVTISRDHHPAAGKFLDGIKAKGLSERIVNLGPIPQERLAAHFLNVEGLLMPTLLESFSGSYLEAMHFGVPILTSDLDFAHEVCGDAASYFDPWDDASIRDAILDIRNRPDKASELVRKGKERLSGMSKTWEEIARSVLEKTQSLADEKRC